MNTHIKKLQSNLQAKVNCSLADIEHKIQAFNSHIFVAQTDACLEKVLQLRQATYENYMPDVNYKALEAVDYHSIVMYSKDANGQVVSTSRLVLDSEAGFAEDYVYKSYIQPFREQGQLLAEWGRCITPPYCKVRAVDYALAIQHMAQHLGIDQLLIFNRRCDVNRIIRQLKGSKVLEETDISLGSKHKFVAMLWPFNDTEKDNIYADNTWTDYAKSFMTVTSTIQAELFKESAQHLSGKVVDCGAGCAKIAPYLRHRKDVSSYLGIDASPVMCEYGKQVLQRVGRQGFAMVESLIQDYKAQDLYDSAISLNSLYTWPEPQLVLEHIHSLLKPNGHFVLATINADINMTKLIEEGEPDLLMHPDVEAFRAVNQQLAANKKAKLLSLDNLLRLVHEVGFGVQECHNRFYMGGLSYLVLKRTA